MAYPKEIHYGLCPRSCVITHGRCIDGALFERITGQPFDRRKAPNQRSECGCMTAVDMTKQGQIAGVGIAHRGETEYL